MLVNTIYVNFSSFLVTIVLFINFFVLELHNKMELPNESYDTYSGFVFSFAGSQTF